MILHHNYDTNKLIQKKKNKINDSLYNARKNLSSIELCTAFSGINAGLMLVVSVHVGNILPFIVSVVYLIIALTIQFIVHVKISNYEDDLENIEILEKVNNESNSTDTNTDN